MYTRVLLRSFVYALPASILLLSSCGNNGSKEKVESEVETTKVDSNRATLFQVGDELFSIPSPIQTAKLIKESGANYNSEILNPANKANSYSTKVQKSLNLGVYGADLGYVTMYDQTQDAISFLNASKKIADDLGVTSAFSPSLIKRFEANLGNKDSLLFLVSDAYRASDAYLKNNERDDVGSLILAGGWIESLYFATTVAKTAKSEEINRRIGEQKNTLENLIKLLERYNNNEEFADLVNQLIDLYYLFDEIYVSYEYVKPTTNEKTKTTTINSTSSVDFTEEQLTAIIEKIESIRQFIVG